MREYLMMCSNHSKYCSRLEQACEIAVNNLMAINSLLGCHDGLMIMSQERLISAMMESEPERIKNEKNVCYGFEK